MKEQKELTDALKNLTTDLKGADDAYATAMKTLHVPAILDVTPSSPAVRRRPRMPGHQVDPGAARAPPLEAQAIAQAVRR